MPLIHSASVPVIDDLIVQVFVWRTLREMREQNGMKARANCYALCWPTDAAKSGGVIAQMHFAQTMLDLCLVAHECQHALEHICRTMGIESDEHDEEVRAILAGQMVNNVWLSVAHA